MSAAPATPIRSDDVVADVLARDEALVDVFVRHSPHFDKLRSRALRRTMARLVTVAQAARVAAVPVDALLRDLNAALGLEPEAPAAPAAADTLDETAHHPAAAPVVELDVREDIRMGREPFARIMAAVAALEPGAVLRLRAPFEPAPLFGVLAKRGFAHEARADAPDDWSVWFWRPGGVVTPPSPDVPVGPEPGETPAPGERWLDVRGLEPPEPMLRTLAALESLPPDQTLVQVNVRVPQFLLPLLVERGFAFTIDESTPDRILVRIRRAH